MKIRLRSATAGILALIASLFLVACEKYEQTSFIAEVDEPGYRRGKDLLRQGRNQEALTEFQKVIEMRGLNNAAESHLEIGLLYQYHIRDPISAIYHYRRFRELKPTSPQSDLVRRAHAAARSVSLTAEQREQLAQRIEGMEVRNRTAIDLAEAPMDDKRLLLEILQVRIHGHSSRTQTVWFPYEAMRLRALGRRSI